jgi:hypothetical protein
MRSPETRRLIADRALAEALELLDGNPDLM